jgi:hypothetical protein
MIPGRTLHRLAALLCSPKTLERAVEPAIADLQKEYGAGEGHHARRVWVLLRGYAAILKVIFMCALTVSLPTDEERYLLVRILVWSVALIVVVAALLMLPPLYAFDHSIRGWYAAATLVPQAVPLAIPIGIAFGMAFGLTARLTVGTAKTILLGALAASVLSFGTLAWAMPAGNQAFREIVFRELEARDHDGPATGLQKGYNEMTFTELRREIARFSTEGDFRGARRAVFSFHLRFSLAAATLVLAGFLLAAPVNHRALRGFLAFLTCFVYWALLYAGEVLSVHQMAIPGSAGAWLPNIVLAAAALFFASSSSSRLCGSWSAPR